MWSGPPIGRRTALIASVAATAVLLGGGVVGESAAMIAAALALVGVAVTLHAAPRDLEPQRAAVLVGAAAIGAALSVLLDGSWVAAGIAVVPVAALAAGASALGRVVAIAAFAPFAAAVLATAGSDRFEAGLLVVGGLAAAEVIASAGRVMVDGVRRQKQRLSELGNLLRAADVLAALDDDDRAAGTIPALCRDLFFADASALVVRSDAGGAVVAARHNEELLVPQGDGALESLAARAIAGDEPRAFDPPDIHAAAGVTWVLIIPLRGTNAPMGAVVLGFSDIRPTDNELAEIGQSAAVIARQAGLALERIQSLQRVAAAALRDPLTGAANRRALESVLNQLRPGDAVALIDLDHFKLVNDRHGHAEGDRVLVAFSGFLRRNTSHDAVVGRWGGEEFLVVLRAAHHRAGIVVEELRAAWEAAGERTTFSAGVSLWSRSVEVEDLIEEADQALYEAKERGRNQVMSYSADGNIPETVNDAADV